MRTLCLVFCVLLCNDMIGQGLNATIDQLPHPYMFKLKKSVVLEAGKGKADLKRLYSVETDEHQFKKVRGHISFPENNLTTQFQVGKEFYTFSDAPVNVTEDGKRKILEITLISEDRAMFELELSFKTGDTLADLTGYELQRILADWFDIRKVNPAFRDLVMGAQP